MQSMAFINKFEFFVGWNVDNPVNPFNFFEVNRTIKLFASRSILFYDISMQMLFSSRWMIGKVFFTKLASSISFVARSWSSIRRIIVIKVIPSFGTMLWRLKRATPTISTDIWFMVIIIHLRRHAYTKRDLECTT